MIRAAELAGMGVFLASWKFERKVQIFVFSCQLVLVKSEIQALVYSNHHPYRIIFDHSHHLSPFAVNQSLFAGDKITNVDIDLADKSINRRFNDGLRQLELSLFQFHLGFFNLADPHATRDVQIVYSTQRCELLFDKRTDPFNFLDDGFKGKMGIFQFDSGMVDLDPEKFGVAQN